MLFKMTPLPNEAYLPFLQQIKKLYEDMDQAYRTAADSYGFHCNGCEDNCCQTRFYHHTVIEYLYLHEGLRKLDPETQQRIRMKAKEVCRNCSDTNPTPRLMCPLNKDGRCLLYEYRPMICRLHGIDHELHIPGRGVLYGPGCNAFTTQAYKKSGFRLNRTPYYVQMAKVENELKQRFGIKQKFKMTIAEMLA